MNMRQHENRNVIAFLLLWTVLVATLFLHASGRVDIPLLHFPQAKGILLGVEMNYKGFNLIGLREEVYAIPHGPGFIHPSRIKPMKRNGIFVAHSVQEAKRMVDAGTENIEPKLILKEKDFQGYNLYGLGNHIYTVPAMHAESGAPTPIGQPYSERLAGESVEDAKKFIASGK